MSSKFKELYYQYTIEVYQTICVFLFVVIVMLYGVIEFKTGVMEGYKSTLALLKTRSDEQIREIAVLQEQYKYQTQEIVLLKAKVAHADNTMRKDIEDLKQQQNPVVKHLRK
jgi:hypothetical protein